MKIRALRVREVGILRAPVALEGLSGALDVLSGPNELGKSTLFRALQTVFLLEHKTASGTLKKQLVPDSGGAPVIEVDFDLAADRYRLRKRYFSAAKASLVKLGDGSVARGADAEFALANLLQKAGGAERLGMLWVEQSGSLIDFAAKDAVVSGLKGLVERQLALATGGSRGELVREKVRERLEALVTRERRQPREHYKEAVETRARLEREHEALMQAAARGRAALDRLAVLRDSHARLSDAGVKSNRAARIGNLRSAVEAARSAGDKRRAGEEIWKRLDQDAESAAGKLSEFDRLSHEQLALAGQVQKASDDLAAIRIRLDGSLVAVAAAETGLATAEAVARGNDARLAKARHQQAARSMHVAMRKRLNEVTILAAKAVDLRRDLASNNATPDCARAAEYLNRTVETLEAALAASSARIVVSYQPGAEGRVLRDGTPMQDGAENWISEPIDLVISGIGRIRIEPGKSAGEGFSAADLDDKRQRLADLLVRLGVRDVPALQDLAIRRAQTSTELDKTVAKVEGLCPEGLEQLHADVEQLSAERNDAVCDLPAIEAEARAALDRCGAAEAGLRAVRNEAQALEVGIARQETEVKAMNHRLAELSAMLPPKSAFAAYRADLEIKVSSAVGRAREALLTLAALRENEPDAARMAALELDLNTAIGNNAAEESTANAQSREMAALEADLKRDALDGIGERLAECEGELAAASRQQADMAREVAALSLLDKLFAEASAANRARYLEPVTERLIPYLQTVLPGAGIELGETFGARALMRNGRSETIEKLSHGTREQVAVLVRLGLARFLADTGEPLPLILDDALVYADDTRIEAMFSTLRDAAEVHQVMVLTCRAKSFAALGGTQLALAPWQGFSE